jgi:hypothetical protein
MIRRHRFLPAFSFALALPAQAMTPPSLSVNIMPRSSFSPASNPGGEGWGTSLSLWQSTRRRLLSGRKSVDNPLRERGETIRTTIAIDASPFPRWSFMGAFPHVRSRASFNGGLQRADGPGDALVLAQYAVYQDRAIRPRRQVRLSGGLELPTGETKAEDARGVRLPASQQPGSRSTDGFAGASATWGLPRLSLYGDASWKIQGGAAYQFGDAFSLNAGLNAPLGSWSLTAELSAEAVGRDRSSLPGPGVLPSHKVRDSGHEAAYAAPGLQWRPARGWTLSLGAQLPLYQNYRGTQLAVDVNWTAAVFARFGGA